MAKRKRDGFVGRDGEMQQVKETVSDVVEAYMVGNYERSVSFVVFEGGSGIGKTRCLEELGEEVEKRCTARDRLLLDLYRSGFVHSIFITFNRRGSCVSHMPPPDGGGMDGARFLQCCILSHLLYGRPFFGLREEEQAVINSKRTFTEAMTLVKDILLERNMQATAGASSTCQEMSSGQVVVLYVLLDEMQLLGAHLGRGGPAFIKSMCDAIGRFMREDVCDGTNKNIILLPCLAGCSVPEVGTFGASNWPRRRLLLGSLPPDAVRELARQGLEGKHGDLLDDASFRDLLDDCMGIARFIKWSVGPLKFLEEDLPNSTKVETSRTKMLRAMEDWADHAIEFDTSTEQLRQAFRHCLIGARVIDMELKVTQCIRGYVYWQIVGGETVFQAPVFLLNYLAKRLEMHERLVELQPKQLKNSDLEWACLEMMQVRLCVARGRMIFVNDLFPGSFGASSPELLRVPSTILLKSEDRQFIQGKKCLRRQQDNYTMVDKQEMRLPWYGVVLKCKGNNGIVDGRCFLELAEQQQSTTLEIWFQVKGDEKTSVKSLQQICDDVFAQELRVEGRKKMLVILTPYASVAASAQEEFMTSQADLERLVLVLDSAGCAEYMPYVMQRSQSVRHFHT